MSIQTPECHPARTLKATIINTLIISLICVSTSLFAQQKGKIQKAMDVGIARIDITPETPVRLAGFAVRSKTESEGVLQRLSAKALAFGNDKQGPSIIITIDLIGIPGRVTEEVAERLKAKAGIDRANFTISASHTHSGPEVGNLLNILPYRSASSYSDSLMPVEHLNHINLYVEQLTSKLEQVALAALQARKPSLVSWGQGHVEFAANRRRMPEIVDRSMPLLKVTDPEGNIKGILVNYACHAVSLGGGINKIHGDWVGDAQRLMEANHPGAIAMVSIGCGADANPTVAEVEKLDPVSRSATYGKMIADEAGRLLKTQLTPINAAPAGRIKFIDLPYSHVPTVQELVKQTEDGTVKGYYARLALDRIARGQTIPASLSYPVQTWTFGKDLAMVFLAGEVVAEYSLRLKKEMDAGRLWISSYSNDVPCYIPSERVLQVGGYEGALSMYYYDKPAPFAVGVEDKIVHTVHELMPKSFKTVKK